MTEREDSLSMGGYLRALREARGGSLDDMARATRVGFHQLEALEGEQFAELPAPVFVKGFIRAYCHFLGEPAEEALRRYQGVSVEKPSPSPAAPASPTPVAPAETPSAPVATPSVTPAAPTVAPTPAAAADNP